MSTPQKPTLLLWAVALFVLGGLAWIATFLLTTLDVSWNDELPNSIVIAVSALAATLILTGLTFLLVDKQRRYLLAAWEDVKQEIVAAIAKARHEASADIDAARRDLKNDTGSIPVITDKMMEMPTIGDALAAVAQLAGEVQELRAKLPDYWNGYTAGVQDASGDDGPPGKVLPFDR